MPNNINDSILNSVKKALGIDPVYTVFDPDLVMHINSVFSVLHQIGIGPDNQFYIETSGSETWSDFLSGSNTLNMVESYMYIKVRLLFDPPANTSVLQALKETAAEYEWRMNVEVETPAVTND